MNRFFIVSIFLFLSVLNAYSQETENSFVIPVTASHPDEKVRQLYDEINRRITALAGPVVHKAEDPDANALITPSRANEDYVEEAFSPYQEDYYCPICQQELPAPGAGCIRCDQL